ncbi:hypothetical protein Ahy_B06g081584 [Arachis hypogaea]|uniref:Uncharacterized protein n=1 Tax=Arachis hypogaea TaxID=3818 RepID=A0A444YLH0_ARAHY|nr:hypothetical protein Ahy_B06g081584 [Arachis hypogaea]
MHKKYCWEIRKRVIGLPKPVNTSISQDHSKLDSNTIAEVIKPLVEADPSIKVKSVIPEVQSNMVSKGKSIEKFLEVGKLRLKFCPYGYLRTARKRDETYTNWMDRIPREQYALGFDGGYLWGHMTTNLVEYINSVLKGAHNLLVIALVKATFYRLNELFTRTRAKVEARIRCDKFKFGLHHGMGESIEGGTVCV